MNPPRCRLIDLNSRNGTLLNGVRIQTAEVADGDEIAAGNTVFKVCVIAPEPAEKETLALPVVATPSKPTIDYLPSRSAVPGYRLEGELGRGGMGVVYRAIRERAGLAVALKTIMPAAGASRKQIDRFLRECEILAQLEHPNIVSFRECGEADGLIFLVMDLVDGSDLAARLQEQGPEAVRTGVRIDLSNALGAGARPCQGGSSTGTSSRRTS